MQRTIPRTTPAGTQEITQSLEPPSTSHPTDTERQTQIDPSHMRPQQLPWLRNYQVQNPNRQPKRKNFQTGSEHLLSDGKPHLRTILQGMP